MVRQCPAETDNKINQTQMCAVLAWNGSVMLRRLDSEYIWRAQVKVGLINLCKGLFSLNARIYYKLKSGT